MSAHTPGPWSRRFINVYADERIVVTAQWPIKDGELPDAKQLAEVKANARLVSAAPDMFEALTCLLAAIEPGGFSLEDLRGEMADANAALKKARGES